MRKVTLIEIYRFLKYMNLLSTNRFYQQVKTRYWCAVRHKGFRGIPMLHGAGRYVYQAYKCECGAIHYEFKMNYDKLFKEMHEMKQAIEDYNKP